MKVAMDASVLWMLARASAMAMSMSPSAARRLGSMMALPLCSELQTFQKRLQPPQTLDNMCKPLQELPEAPKEPPRCDLEHP